MDGPESVELLNEILDRIDSIAEHHGVEPVKTIGEHYLAACGLAVPRLDHAVRAVEFADAVAGEIALIAAERGLALAMRAAIASGVLHAGLVGSSRFVYDVWGRPLNLVRSLVHDAEVNEVRVTEAIYRQLGPESGFAARPATESLMLGEIESFGRGAALPAAAGTPRSGSEASEDGALQGSAPKEPAPQEAPREAAQ